MKGFRLTDAEACAAYDARLPAYYDEDDDTDDATPAPECMEDDGCACAACVAEAAT